MRVVSLACLLAHLNLHKKSSSALSLLFALATVLVQFREGVMPNWVILSEGEVFNYGQGKSCHTHIPPLKL